VDPQIYCLYYKFLLAFLFLLFTCSYHCPVFAVSLDLWLSLSVVLAEYRSLEGLGFGHLVIRQRTLFLGAYHVWFILLLLPPTRLGYTSGRNLDIYSLSPLSLVLTAFISTSSQRLSLHLTRQFRLETTWAETSGPHMMGGEPGLCGLRLLLHRLAGPLTQPPLTHITLKIFSNK
jgi:hypothetical protein